MQILATASQSPRSVAYHIKRRGGETLYTITNNTPDQAFIAALYHVKMQYLKAGVPAPMFDTEPLFYFEAV